MITVTRVGNVPKQYSDQLMAAVPPSVDIRDGNQQFVRSVDGPSFINMLGDSIGWGKYLGDAAWTVASTLGGWALSHANKKLPEVLRKAEAKVLLDLALTIHDIQVASGNVKVAIGFDLPDDRFGTAFSVQGDSVEDIAFKLAMCVNAAEKIEALVREETSIQKALGPILVSFDPVGAVQLKWMTQETLEVIERRIELQPIAEAVAHEPTDEKKVEPIPVDFGN
jgi:hypothetical protein